MLSNKLALHKGECFGQICVLPLVLLYIYNLYIVIHWYLWLIKVVHFDINNLLNYYIIAKLNYWVGYFVYKCLMDVKIDRRFKKHQRACLVYNSLTEN